MPEYVEVDGLPAVYPVGAVRGCDTAAVSAVLCAVLCAVGELAMSLQLQ